MTRFPGRPAEEFGFHEILYTKSDWIARITINRPDVHNSFTSLTLQEMTTALRDAAWDDHVGVVVLTGTGDRAFCTGADVREYTTEYLRRPHDYWKYMGSFYELVNMFLNVGKPTIARLNGVVAGGGNELNVACDLAIAADTVKIMQVGPKVGSVPAAGATQWLPVMVGDRRAREMIMLCEPISAEKALEWGLVNRVVPYDQLDAAVDDMAAKLLDKFPDCMRYSREQLNFWKNFSWHLTAGHGREWLSLHKATAEPYEGMSAFVEKRPADHMGMRQRAADGGSGEFLWGAYARICPSCGARGLPETFKFCGVCGAPL